MSNKEGWTWLSNSKKWHYFRDAQSLCGKFVLFAVGDLEQGNDASPDNCSACRKKLEKERQLTPHAAVIASQQSAHTRLLRADPRSAVAHPTSESTADNRRAKSATSG